MLLMHILYYENKANKISSKKIARCNNYPINNDEWLLANPSEIAAVVQKKEFSLACNEIMMPEQMLKK